MPDTPARICRVLAPTVLCAGLLGGGAVVLAPAPSYAASVTLTDATHDPVRLDDQDDDGELETTPAPDARAVDIEATDVVYRHHVLVVRVHARGTSHRVSPRVRVRADGSDHGFSVDDRGRVYDDSRGGGRRCRGASVEWDGPAHVYRFRLPAGCFGTPDQVRVGVQLTRVGDTTPSSVTLDDAVKGGGGRYYYRVGLGPRVARG